MKNTDNKITMISLIIVILVLSLSIGWSAFNSSLQVDSAVLVRIKSDIRITGFNYISGTNGSSSSNDNYNVNYVFGTINLPNETSTVKYKVEITNMELASNVNMGIKSLSGLPDNLKIVSIDDYTLKSKICDDNNSNDCGTGAQKTFYITIGYKDSASFDSSNTTYNFNIDFEFKKVHDIIYTGFDNPPISPKTFMEEEMPTITFTDTLNDLKILSGGNNLILNTNYTLNNQILTFITPINDDIYIINPTIYTMVVFKLLIKLHLIAQLLMKILKNLQKMVIFLVGGMKQVILNQM